MLAFYGGQMVDSTVELACKGHKHGVGDHPAQTHGVLRGELTVYATSTLTSAKNVTVALGSSAHAQPAPPVHRRRVHLWIRLAHACQHAAIPHRRTSANTHLYPAAARADMTPHRGNLRVLGDGLRCPALYTAHCGFFALRQQPTKVSTTINNH
jgi:hypothetical protein